MWNLLLRGHYTHLYRLHDWRLQFKESVDNRGRDLWARYNKSVVPEIIYGGAYSVRVIGETTMTRGCSLCSLCLGQPVWKNPLSAQRQRYRVQQSKSGEDKELTPGQSGACACLVSIAGVWPAESQRDALLTFYSLGPKQVYSWKTCVTRKQPVRDLLLACYKLIGDQKHVRDTCISNLHSI